MGGGDVFRAIDAWTPIERLKPVAFVDSHCVGKVAGLDDPELRIGTVFDGLRTSGRPGEACGGEKECGGWSQRHGVSPSNTDPSSVIAYVASVCELARRANAAPVTRMMRQLSSITAPVLR